MEYIKSDLRYYAALVFSNSCCMAETIKTAECFIETIKIGKEDPRIETINVIEEALPVLKAQTAAWMDHRQRLEQFIPEVTAKAGDSELYKPEVKEETVDEKIVSVLKKIKRVSDLCEKAGSLRAGIMRYLNRKIHKEGTTEQQVQQLLEELLEPGIEIGYLSDLWKHLTRPRILWRMYLQDYVLLEVRKQKEVFLISSILKKFIFKTSEEGSNFGDCVSADGEDIDNISVGRCVKLARDYKRKGFLEEKNILNVRYNTDPVVQYIREHGMTEMWNVASEYFLEELESGYGENNLWVITDDLCKMAYAVISIETSHLICRELSEVLSERFRMFDVYEYSPIAAMILNCANRLYKYLCKHDGKQWMLVGSKAEVSKRQELDRIFTGGRKVLEEWYSSGIGSSPIYYGYMSVLSSDQNDVLEEQIRSAMYFARHNTVIEYNDLVSKLDALGHNGLGKGGNTEMYHSRIICADEPLFYFEPNAGRSWGDLSTINEVLCSIRETLDCKIRQEADSIKRNELMEIHQEMEKTVLELTDLCEKTGNAICSAEEMLTMDSNRRDPIDVLRFIHPAYPYSRELLSWRYGNKWEPLAIQDIQIQNGFEGAAYTISSGSEYGFFSVYYNSRHKEIGCRSGSFVY